MRRIRAGMSKTFCGLRKHRDNSGMRTQITVRKTKKTYRAGENRMRFNDLPERCKDCQNLKVWALDMGGNHAVTCKKGIWNIKNDKCDKREGN